MSVPGFITFEIPGRPRPKGNARRPVVIAGKPRLMEDKKIKAVGETLAARAYAHRPPEPWTCPVILRLVFVFAAPKSWNKAKREEAIDGRLRHTKKPDVDNLVKMAKDALTGAFFVDDSQVFRLEASKHYGTEDKTVVSIEACPEVAP